jgi:hypothetical protein
MAKYITVAMTLLLSVTAAAQGTRPDFSGTWIQIDGFGKSNDPDIEDTTTIVQRPTEIRSSITVRDKRKPNPGRAPLVNTIRTDGTEERTVSGSTVTVSRASWRGDRLVLDVVTSVNGKVVSTGSRIWSLASDGTLVIEATTSTTSGQAAKTIMRFRRR